MTISELVCNTNQGKIKYELTPDYIRASVLEDGRKLWQTQNEDTYFAEPFGLVEANGHLYVADTFRLFKFGALDGSLLQDEFLESFSTVDESSMYIEDGHLVLETPSSMRIIHSLEDLSEVSHTPYTKK